MSNQLSSIVLKVLHMNWKKIAAPYYLIVLCIHCGLLWMEYTTVSKFTKALLMPLLLVYLYKALSSPFMAGKIGPTTDHEGNVLSNRPISKPVIVIAFLTAWAGDLFLMFNGMGVFIAGMVSFMIAHICYIYLFNQIQPYQKKHALVPVLIGFIVLHFGNDIMSVIRPSLDKILVIPIYIYIFIITLMAMFAFMTLVLPDTKYWGQNFFTVGAGCFVISDMFLALNIFAFHNHLIGVVVMVTYGLAQYKMAKGFSSYLLRQ